MNNGDPYRIDYELLGKHLAGECTPSEAAEVSAWLAADPANQSEYDALAQVWDTSQAEPALVDVDAAWKKVQHRMGSAPAPAPSLWKRYGWYAAVAMLVVAAGLVLFFNRDGLEPTSQVTFANATDQPASTELPDGSTVTLRPGASITYAEGLPGTERRVKFTGEGYFDVKEKSARPFIVEAGGAEIRVLGTEFNVRAEEEVVVQVTEGVVEFKGASAESAVKVEAGQQVRYDKGKVGAVETLDDNALFWRNRRLKYNQTPLEEVARDLQQFYQVSIQFEPKAVENCRLNAVFVDESIESIVEVISTSMQLEAQQDGTTITFSGDGC